MESLSLPSLEEARSNTRGAHVFVIEWVLSGRTPGELLAMRRPDLAALIIDYLRQGNPQPDLAMTDPSLYRRLREACTCLIMKGWW